MAAHKITKTALDSLDELLPDVVQMQQQTVVDQYRDTVSSVKVVCDELTKHLIDDYNTAIAECKRQCNESHDNCAACYQSTIKDFQDRISKIDAKCQAQAREALTYAISNGLQYIYSLGVKVVDEKDIATVNAPAPVTINPTTGDTGGGRCSTDFCKQFPAECPECNVIHNCPKGSHWDAKQGACVIDSDTGGDGGPGGGGPGGGPGGGGPGNGCVGSATDPCANIPANYIEQQAGNRTTYYLKVPVYDSCGNLVGCWQQPIPCVPPTDPTCYINKTGGPCDLTTITGKTPTGKCAGTCPKITSICITCTDPNNCVPPWECPDGWTYNPETGQCTQKGDTGTDNGCGPYTSKPKDSDIPAGKIAVDNIVTRLDGIKDNWFVLPNTFPSPYTWDSKWQWPSKPDPTNPKCTLFCGFSGGYCDWEDNVVASHCDTDTGGGDTGGGPGNPPPTGDYCGLGDQFHQPGVTAETPFQYQDIANKLATGIGDISSLGGIVNTVLDTLSGGKLSDVVSGSLGFGSLIKIGGSVLLNAVGGLIADFVPCNSAEFGAATAAGVVTGLLNNLGIIPDLAITQIRYAENYNCQYLIPGQGQLDSAFLHGELQERDWSNGTRMNGNCVPWATAVRDAGYFRFSPADLIELNRRGLIEQGDFDNRIALTNIRNSDDTELLKQLANYKQTVDSSISQNLVGADSETLSSTLQTSEGFEDWYSSNGYRIADSYGYSQQQAEQLYRQSRRLPDIGLVFDAYRRIQSDTDINGTGRKATPVTSDELDAYLNATGMPSVWANRAAAMTYAPISIRHLKLLYETGEIDVQELAERYEALTYSPEDAKHLANALAVTTNEAKSKIEGITDKATAVKLFQEDGINEDTLYQMLFSAGILPDSIQSIIDTAKTTRDAAIRRRKVSSLKKRFLMGDYDVATVGGKLADYGIANERIGQIISDWREELELEHKLPSAQAICQWFTRRFITVDDYLQRLSNLGYSADDAANFVAACTSEAADKLAKQAAAEAAKRAKALEKQLKDEAKAIEKAKQCRQPAKPVCGAKQTVKRTVTKRSKSTLNAGITVAETATQIEPTPNTEVLSELQPSNP